ncbi:uncharacterized protein N7498_008878 [Penicillium cinerascens]|uniref:Uncharacterized protein n=1 Tax=Penicillium cinerascens TaxID=70096 RepID=A0A9W9JEJ5_9EURO|nr:uncharacterized protein N7498_008878 [Penicillium cinerascens]KAJ5195440.1 hypothetical protein N7498_008878 [Penicillium cinerascens]
MFGKEETPPDDPTLPAAARLNEIYIGEDWKPTPEDYSNVPTVPTDAARQGAMNYKLPEDIPQRKDCVGFVKAMTWTSIFFTAAITTAAIAFISFLCWIGPRQHLEALEHKANAYNQSHHNATEESFKPPPPTYIPRFWEESSIPIPTASLSSSLLTSVSLSTTPATHTTFITRTGAATSVQSTPQTFSA